MRLAPDRPWLPFWAEQWFACANVDFQWRAWMRMKPFMSVRVVDSFQNGRGTLIVSAFGLVRIVRSQGPAIDKGEVLRGLAEFPWRPFAFREAAYLTWEAVGEDKLRARFDDGRTQATGEFQIDPEGRVLGGTTDRPRTDGKSVVETKWSGTFNEYREVDHGHRVRIPTLAEVAWHMPKGSFTYCRARVTEFSVLPCR